MTVFATPRPFALTTPSGHRIHGLVDLPDLPSGGGRRPAIVVCHGFKGFMEWGFFPPLAKLLASRGFVVVRFNFSGSGMAPGEERATDPEGFTANTFSREQEDLATVLAELEGAIGETAEGRIDPARLGLFGHSRGGGSAIVAAGSGAWKGRTAALVTWAAVATFDRMSADEKARWRRDGELPVVNSRTGQVMALGLDLLEDFERNAAALDVGAAAGRVRAPWLIVHGEADESVSVEEGRRLAGAQAGAAGARAELLLVPEAGHTFGAVHPFAGPTPHLIAAMNATQGWFTRHLR